MRKLLIGLVAVGFVLAGVLVALVMPVMPGHCPVTGAACDRIEKGMTLAQVEQILGGPPGDYRTQPTAYPPGIALDLREPSGRIENWDGDEGIVVVVFSPGPERVMFVNFIRARASNPGPVARATWRLGRLRARVLP
jgi:hypothetical protein